MKGGFFKLGKAVGFWLFDTRADFRNSETVCKVWGGVDWNDFVEVGKVQLLRSWLDGPNRVRWIFCV
jgi:hypothetical protein